MNIIEWLQQFFLYNPREPFLFYSFHFLAFFPLFLIFFYLSQRKFFVRNFLLFLFNFFFYYKLAGTNGLLVLVIIAVSDYLFAQGTVRFPKFRRLFYYLGILVSLGMLLYYKYTYFFAEIAGDLTGTPWQISWKIIKPLGISYFVFRSVSYLTDVYEEEIEIPEKNPVNYFAYIFFFPALIAGPIHRATDFLPQLKKRSSLEKENFSLALLLFTTGFFKKTLADQIGLGYVDRMFSAPEMYSGLEHLFAGFSYAIQLFLDFCGYTDMAVGVALLLGFEIPHNFKSPFKALSVSDFWKRWHITLSEWLQDYLFMPLNFSFRAWGTFGTALAVFITFVLSGLWHGAAYNYLLWGIAHALVLAYEILTKKLRKSLNSPWFKGTAWLFTFLFLVFTFAIFRAENTDKLGIMLVKIFTDTDFFYVSAWLRGYYKIAFFVVSGFALHFLPENFKEQISRKWQKQPYWSLFILTLAIIIITLQLRSIEAQEFIYLKF